MISLSIVDNKCSNFILKLFEKNANWQLWLFSVNQYNNPAKGLVGSTRDQYSIGLFFRK